MLAKGHSSDQGSEREAETKTASEIEVFVEKARSGEHYIVVLGTKRKMFSCSELQKLIGIAHTVKDEKASGEQIYNWLKQNRGDVLVDVNLANKKHPLFIKLAKFLRSHFTIKK